jgi:hypothetical protein
MVSDIDLEAPKRPCSECPWRRDVPTGIWPVERFVALAHTAYDMNIGIFACHKSAQDHPTVCAGFLARGADHNLTIRRAYMTGELERTERSGGLNLYPSYRAMAIANGVPDGERALDRCREPHLHHDE